MRARTPILAATTFMVLAAPSCEAEIGEDGTKIPRQTVVVEIVPATEQEGAPITSAPSLSDEVIVNGGSLATRAYTELQD